MRSARVVTVCSSSTWAGTEKWALLASEELFKRGREVTFVCRKPELFEFRFTVNLPIVQLSIRNDLDFNTVLHLAKIFKARADVVILTRVRDYWLGGLAARIAGVPALLRLGVVRQLRNNYIMDRLKYGMLPSAILVNAEIIRTTLLHTPWIREKDIHVIYNGVDAPGPLEDDMKARARQQIAVKEDDFLIVGVGRLAVEKRWDWLVDAVAELVEDGYPVTARLVGRGSEKERIKERIRENGLSTTFILPGERRDSHLWLAAADVVALPSSNEGISNAMIEAMGRGVPVVATESGGIKELFTNGENALISGTEDFDGFVKCLENIVKDAELRRKIGLNGLETVRRHFVLGSMADALEELLDSVAWGGK